MLQRHLIPHTTQLDERQYRVVFRDDLEYQANLEFHESGALAAPWLEDAYRAGFQAKLQSIGFSLPAGATVLDACCGFGYLGRFVAEEYGAKIVFCDLSQFQLADLRERLPGDVSRWALAADVMRLPYRDGAFDAVVGNSFLHHLPDVPRALAEFRRVLKPGGMLILLHEPAVSANFWESFPLSLLKDTSPTSGFTDLWVFEREELLRLARDSGFERTDVIGTGGISALILNWFLILGVKLNWQRRFPMYAVYAFRSWLNRLESRLPRALKPWSSPSLMLVARNEARNPK